MSLNITPASSLLSLEIEQDRHAAQVGGRTWTTGVHSLDHELPGDIWTGGNVIGIGASTEGPTKPISLEIITTHLINEATTQPTNDTADTQNQEQPPSVFIIAPPTQATSSIQRIYQLLQARLVSQPPHESQAKTKQPPADAKRLLNSISLLQYLDISGLSESLGEVFGVVRSRPVSARTILLVQGLTSTVSATQRRSGVVQTAALVAAIMQGIRGTVKKSGGLCIGFVELEVAWSQPPGAASNAYAGKGLDTAFASMTGKVLRLNSSTVLSQIVEGETDVIVAVHDGSGRIDVRKDERRIVEVVRDERVGCAGERSAIHSWTVW